MVKMTGDKRDCGMHPPDMETLGALKDIYFTCCRCGDHLHVSKTIADIKDKWSVRLASISVPTLKVVKTQSTNVTLVKSN